MTKIEIIKSNIFNQQHLFIQHFPQQESFRQQFFSFALHALQDSYLQFSSFLHSSQTPQLHFSSFILFLIEIIKSTAQEL